MSYDWISIEDKIAVMQAAVEGECIEFRKRGTDDPWIPLSGQLRTEWSWGVYTYRVKQKPLEMWAVVYPNGKKVFFFSREGAESHLSNHPTHGYRFAGVKGRIVHFIEAMGEDNG